MKTATEHLHTLENFLHPTEAWVKQIQLDAYRQGMADAAEIAQHPFGPNFPTFAASQEEWNFIRTRILTARDNKTSL